MRRRIVVVAMTLVGVAVLSLTSCTVPPSYGIRLNADSTIDFVVCGTVTPLEVTVDYEGNDSASAGAEWVATFVDGLPLSRVVRYGDYAYESAVLEDPPTDWLSVEAVYGASARRSELEEGQWVWFDSEAAFVPGRPCDDVSAEELSR